MPSNIDAHVALTSDKADYETESEDDGEDVEWVCCDRCELWYSLLMTATKIRRIISS